MEYYHRCPNKRMDLVIGSRTTVNSSLNGLGISTNSTSSSAAKTIFASQSDTPSQKVIRKQFSRSRERLGQSLTGNDSLGRLLSNEKTNKNFSGISYISNAVIVDSTPSYNVPLCSASDSIVYKNIAQDRSNSSSSNNCAQDKEMFTHNLNYTSTQQRCFDQPTVAAAALCSTEVNNQRSILQSCAVNNSQAPEISQQNSISLAYNRNAPQQVSNLINNAANHQTVINSTITSNTLRSSVNPNQNNSMGSLNRIPLSNPKTTSSSNMKVSLNPDENIAQRLSTTTINNIKDITDSHHQHSRIKRSSSITLNNHHYHPNNTGITKKTQLISSTTLARNSMKFFDNNTEEQSQQNNLKTENSSSNNNNYNNNSKQQFQFNSNNSNKNANNAFFNHNKHNNHNTCPGYSEFNANYEGNCLTDDHNYHTEHQEGMMIQLTTGSSCKTIDQIDHPTLSDCPNSKINEKQDIFNRTALPPPSCGCARSIAELKVALSEMRKNVILSEQKQLQLEEENKLLWRNIHHLESELISQQQVQEQSNNIANKENAHNYAGIEEVKQREKIMKTNKKLQKRNSEMEEVIKQVLLQQELHKQRERNKIHSNNNKTTLPTNNCSVSQISEGLLQSSQSSLFAGGVSDLTSPNISKAAGSEPKPQRPRNNSEEISCNPGLLKKLTDQRKIPQQIAAITNDNYNGTIAAAGVNDHEDYNNDEYADEEYHQYYVSEKQVLQGDQNSSYGAENECQQKKLDMKERLILSKIHEVPSFANFQSN